MLDIAAISGICGSISIACWVVVFSPQIIENFRRSSAEGLSVEFVIIWLAGDVFNILGSVLQGVLPTMIILAIYYTFADVVLLAQCFYYRGLVFRDPRPDIPTPATNAPTETSPLLNGNSAGNLNVPASSNQHVPNAADVEYTPSRSRRSSFRERLTSIDATHLSPAAPMHPQPNPSSPNTSIKPSRPRSWAQAILFNGTVIILVILAGFLGWYLSPASSEKNDKDQAKGTNPASHPSFNLWGQIFGYICAVLYLASRVPQLLLNYRRKSTEGLNALFFIFACIGNLTYVFSIFAFEPVCSSRGGAHHHGRWQERSCTTDEARAIYGRYMLVNLSWLIGSLGALFLDFAVFGQFWVYRAKAAKKLDNDEEEAAVN
jgi:uncharacterized protein with PQ loop repeat